MMNTDYRVICVHKNFIEAACSKITKKYRSINMENDLDNNPDYNQQLQSIYDFLVDKIEDDNKSIGLIIENNDNQICLQYLKLPEQEKSNEENKKNKQETYLQKAICYIQENFVKNITIKDVCEYLEVSSPYLHKIFASYIGKTPYQYIMDCKLNKAKELLRDTNHTIEEISLMSGFINRSHFSTAFKRKEGIPPLEYRKTVKY